MDMDESAPTDREQAEADTDEEGGDVERGAGEDKGSEQQEAPVPEPQAAHAAAQRPASAVPDAAEELGIDSLPFEEQSMATMPEPSDYSHVLDRMLELAGEYLEPAVTTKIDLWQDGTYRLRVYSHAPGIRHQLYYHAEEAMVKFGIINWETDEVEHVEAVERVDPIPPTGR
jgi:hypothetical protein